MPAPKKNKNAVGNEGGAPTKYKPEYNEQAYKLCLLGFTDKELATFFEVDESTIGNWKKDHIEFFLSVKGGKDMADAEVAESFFKRAKGYEFTEVTFEKVDNKMNLEVTPDALITTDAYRKRIVLKHLPADAGAALNWLKNRQKALWRDKQTLEFDFDSMTEAELDMIIDRMTKKANNERS